MHVLLRLAALATAACWLMLPSSGAVAQDYPTKSVRMIVPFGAGGPADVYARVLAQHLSDSLKQSFVVETTSKFALQDLATYRNVCSRLFLLPAMFSQQL
jgi:hypothetical protein